MLRNDESFDNGDFNVEDDDDDEAAWSLSYTFIGHRVTQPLYGPDAKR